MSDKGFKINIEQAKAYTSDKGRIAHAIESLLKHDGWNIFLALFDRTKRDIKDKGNYPTIEDFRADRRALEIVEEIFKEMSGYAEDAQGAQDLLQKLTNAENLTPISLLLDNEDEDQKEA